MNALKGRLDGNLGIKSWELEFRVQDLGLGFSIFLAVRGKYSGKTNGEEHGNGSREPSTVV